VPSGSVLPFDQYRCCSDSGRSRKQPKAQRNAYETQFEILRSEIVAAWVFAALSISGLAAHAESGPFAEMAGVRSGAGTTSLDNGAS
jgi:hypothetical protein